MGELSRKGGRFGHAMLADSWACHKVWWFALPVLHHLTLDSICLHKTRKQTLITDTCWHCCRLQWIWEQLSRVPRVWIGELRFGVSCKHAPLLSEYLWCYFKLPWGHNCYRLQYLRPLFFHTANTAVCLDWRSYGDHVYSKLCFSSGFIDEWNVWKSVYKPYRLCWDKYRMFGQYLLVLSGL